jgi:hypothetical protein
MVDLVREYIYYRQLDSYGVSVPIIFQELLIIISMIFTYAIPKVLYYGMIVY